MVVAPLIQTGGIPLLRLLARNRTLLLPQVAALRRCLPVGFIDEEASFPIVSFPMVIGFIDGMEYCRLVRE